MKMQTITRAMLMLFISIQVLSNTALAQEWSAGQKEVWKAVENWWVLYDNNNVEGIKALFHKDYKGWSWGENAPDGHKEALRWASHMIPKNKIAYTNLRPLDILIMGDVAVLHYYFSSQQSVDGKDTVRQGRWTDVWKKESGKWLLIADSGGTLSTN
jgi:ketosteroid isomerase-like protein